MKIKSVNKEASSLTIRLLRKDKKRLEEEAQAAGLSLSEYLRRRIFGGRPIVAFTDANTVRELRRIGGLLKGNFETLRGANAPFSVLKQQEDTLAALVQAIEQIGAKNDR